MNERAALPRRSSLASVAFVAFDSTSVALARARRVPTFSVDVDRKIHQSNACVNSSINRVGAGCLARARGGGTPWGVTHPRLRPIERTRDRRTDGRTVHIVHTRNETRGVAHPRPRRAPASSRATTTPRRRDPSHHITSRRRRWRRRRRCWRR